METRDLWFHKNIDVLFLPSFELDSFKIQIYHVWELSLSQGRGQFRKWVKYTGSKLADMSRNQIHRQTPWCSFSCVDRRTQIHKLCMLPPAIRYQKIVAVKWAFDGPHEKHICTPSHTHTFMGWVEAMLMGRCMCYRPTRQIRHRLKALKCKRRKGWWGQTEGGVGGGKFGTKKETGWRDREERRCERRWLKWTLKKGEVDKDRDEGYYRNLPGTAEICYHTMLVFLSPLGVSGKVIVLQDHEETKARFWKTKIYTC